MINLTSREKRQICKNILGKTLPEAFIYAKSNFLKLQVIILDNEKISNLKSNDDTIMVIVKDGIVKKSILTKNGSQE